MDISDRVKQRRKELGLSQERLAELLHVKQPSIQKLEKGRVRNPKYLKRLAMILKTTQEWLQFGIGSDIIQPPITLIPVLDWNEAIDNEKSLREKPAKERETVPMTGICGSKCYALKVKGDSMVSTIPGRLSFLEDYVIIVDPEREPQHGNFVIAKQKKAEEPIFKQYIIDGDKAYLRPLNPQYPLITIDENIEIYGVVIAQMNMLV